MTVAERKVRNRQTFLVTQARDHLVFQDYSLIDVGDDTVAFPTVPTIVIEAQGGSFPYLYDIGFDPAQRLVGGTRFRVKIQIADDLLILPVDQVASARWNVSRSDTEALNKIMGDGVFWDESGDDTDPGQQVLVIEVKEADTAPMAGLYRHQLLLTTDDGATFAVLEGSLQIIAGV